MTVAILFDSSTKSWNKVEVATPEPGIGEILVRVLACTVCGSDLHTVAGRRDTPSPTILGHEIVGQIAEFGPGAIPKSIDGLPLAIGDRVVWSVVVNCGDCFFCNRGLPQKCLRASKYGHALYSSPQDLCGGFAEHVLLKQGTKCQKISAEIPLELACPIGCATATAIAAVDALQNKEEINALVIGGGLVGLMTCACLRSSGARTVCCIEPNIARRELSVRFGATQSLAKLDECTSPDNGFDSVFECSGQNSAFEDSIKAVRVGGEVVLVGAVFPSPPVNLVVERIVRRNLRLTGIHNYNPEQLLRAVQFTENWAQDFPRGSIVDQWFNLSDMDQAFAHAVQSGPLRVGIAPKIER